MAREKFVKRPLTDEEKTAKRQAEHQELQAAIENLASEAGFQRWLKVRTTASLRRFSFYNQCLVAYQKPDAQLVRTFKGWMDLGRKVKKGERAIMVLRPVPVFKDETDPETGEVKRVQRGVFFTGLKEFDISQTEGEPVDFEEFTLDGDQLAEWKPKLEAHAVGRGWKVEYKPNIRANGYCRPSDKKIVIKHGGRSEDDQVRTLIHEIAHSYDIDYTKFSREDAEIIVEMTTALILIQLGMEDISVSAQYIAAWCEGDLDKVRARVQIADKVAAELEQALGLGAA